MGATSDPRCLCRGPLGGNPGIITEFDGPRTSILRDLLGRLRASRKRIRIASRTSCLSSCLTGVKNSGSCVFAGMVVIDWRQSMHQSSASRGCVPERSLSPHARTQTRSPMRSKATPRTRLKPIHGNVVSVVKFPSREKFSIAGRSRSKGWASKGRTGEACKQIESSATSPTSNVRDTDPDSDKQMII